MSVLNSLISDEWEYLNIPISDIENILNSGEYDIEVESPDGYVEVTDYINKGVKRLYELNVDGKILLCSGKHVVYTQYGWKSIDSIINGDKILISNNIFEPCNINITDIYDEVVDIRVNHNNHRYYTNGIVSHNTNMGKSLIMGAMATNNVFQGKKVLYVTCEMSEFKIGERILQNSFDMSSKDIKRLPRDKFGEAFKRARNNLKGRFIVKEYPTGVATTNHLRNLIKELWLKKKFAPDIIYIDYVGIMASAASNKNDNTYTTQKKITEEVRGLAVELGIPIISAIQTNRSGMGKEELDLTNVSDSIGTAFTADIMIGVTQPPELRAAGKYRWILIKNRYGPNAVGVTVKVDYHKMRLTDDGIVTDEKIDSDNESSKEKIDKPLKKKESTEKPKNRKIIRKSTGTKTTSNIEA